MALLFCNKVYRLAPGPLGSRVKKKNMLKQGQLTEHLKAAKPARKSYMDKVKKPLTTVNLMASEPKSAEDESDQEQSRKEIPTTPPRKKRKSRKNPKEPAV